MPAGAEVRGEHLVHGLVGPEGVVGGMRDQLFPEADLLEAVPPAEFAGGAGAHVLVVVVEVRGPPLGGVVARAACS